LASMLYVSLTLTFALHPPWPFEPETINLYSLPTLKCSFFDSVISIVAPAILCFESGISSIFITVPVNVGLNGGGFKTEQQKAFAEKSKNMMLGKIFI